MSSSFMNTSNQNLLHSYQQITDKLKRKRFLRKPNYGEAITSYSNLVAKLKRENQHRFAAFVMLAISRCYEATHNSAMQAIELRRSGGLFWSEACAAGTENFTEFEENTEQAIHCYLLSINIYLNLKKFAIASTLLYEMASALAALERFREAAVEFRRAAELLQSESSLLALNALFHAFRCSIEYGEYLDSFKDLQWILKLATEEAHETQSQFFIAKKEEALLALMFIHLLLDDLPQARLSYKLYSRAHCFSHIQTPARRSSSARSSLTFPSSPISPATAAAGAASSSPGSTPASTSSSPFASSPLLDRVPPASLELSQLNALPATLTDLSPDALGIPTDYAPPSGVSPPPSSPPSTPSRSAPMLVGGLLPDGKGYDASWGVDSYFTSEWILQLLEDVLDAFENNDQLLLLDLHAELSPSLTPLHVRLLHLIVQNAPPRFSRT